MVPRMQGTDGCSSGRRSLRLRRTGPRGKAPLLQRWKEAKSTTHVLQRASVDDGLKNHVLAPNVGQINIHNNQQQQKGSALRTHVGRLHVLRPHRVADPLVALLVNVPPGQHGAALSVVCGAPPEKAPSTFAAGASTHAGQTNPVERASAKSDSAAHGSARRVPRGSVSTAASSSSRVHSCG